MTRKDEVVEFPNGTAIIYEDEKHAYYRRKDDGSRGRRLSAVTTVIKPIDFKPDGLMRWAAKQNGTGIAELVSDALSIEDVEEIREALGWATSAESIWTTLEDAKLTYADVRDRAAKRGTNVHQLVLEALATGEPTPDYDGLEEEEVGFAKAVTAWWLDSNLTPEDCEAVEAMVYSERLGVAGRMDLRIRSRKDGEPIIVDLKTSKYVGNSAHVQLAGYDYLSRECGIGGSSAQYVLQVRGDGSYSLIKGVATHEDFLAAVDLYRRSARVEKAAKESWVLAMRGGEEAEAA